MLITTTNFYYGGKTPILKKKKISNELDLIFVHQNITREVPTGAFLLAKPIYKYLTNKYRRFKNP